MELGGYGKKFGHCVPCLLLNVHVVTRGNNSHWLCRFWSWGGVQAKDTWSAG